MTPQDAAQGLWAIYLGAFSVLVTYRIASNYIRRMVDR